MKKWLLMTIFVLIIGVLAACGGGNETSGGKEGKEKVVIGYFPNIDHAPAMIAREKGYYEEALGENVEIEYRTFPDGGTFMTALKSGEIDTGLVGPGPVLNNYSNGANVKIIGGASTGGTVVVASEQSGIENLEDMKGKTFITPGIGCTHDVQFETFLMEKDLDDLASARIGGSLKHVTGNPATYQGMFETGQVDLAAVPEPWATILIENGANVVVSTEEIAYGENLPNVVLVASGNLIEENKETVQGLVKAQQKAIDFIHNNQEETQDIVIKAIKDLTKQEMDKEIVAKAMDRMTYTTEIDEEVLKEFGQSSFDLEFLKETPNFDGLVLKSN
ncbi:MULTISPECIES: ABC transporter substrate-binding protein [Bacillaceae]|uniref:ABC transporter substrate-binding protein n=1 Tax=Oceanobacillus caeni TaxID=405946 RepID=A0ABR5MMV7_9BACI|nr:MULTISPECIES: ABC transporter substrate-binding protein [Bacillaceae]KPH78264.1 ABC transporter substrate-binding protein [Oceanobacillus caeni]MED4474540.1 ABC transporter substrate-binding protein [Oceanobacillus caeni]